jgi:alkylhydroperoxidase family enzyme
MFPGSGSQALLHHAPAAADTLDQVVATTWSMSTSRGFVDVVAVASRLVTALHRTELLLPPAQVGGFGWTDVPPTDWRRHAGLTDFERATLAFAEQCTLDVSSVTPELRGDFLSTAGHGAGDLAAAFWVVDLVPRARAGLDALFGPGPWPEAPGTTGTDLWGVLDGLIRVVPALDALDPVTSELVRLRGARQHDCRLCRSLRSRPALRAGADDAMFAAVDDYRTSALSPLARSALAFTDALIWTPGRIDPAVVAELRSVASPAQQVELVLDVTRNALNKIAVGLGADAAHVEDGIEIYEVGPDGSLAYGLTID